MTDRELLQQALEALEYWASPQEHDEPVIIALRKRLAQPEHEWVRGECIKCGKSMEKPEWQGLAADSTIQTVPAQGGLLPAQFGIRGGLAHDTQNKEQNR